MNKLNIIYIHTHDSGRLFSPYGYKAPTENIEAFAKDATLFRNAYAAAPTCSPSRSALLTGKYPHTNGMFGLSNRGFSITNYREHMVSFLKENGYHSVLCGIQHEAAHFNRPLDGGRIIGYDDNITTKTSLKALDDKRTWDSENCQNACAFLRGYRSAQPFFLSFGMFCTHRPYPQTKVNDTNYIRPPEGFPDTKELREDFAGHFAALHHADDCVGRIMDALKESGLYEKSIILFTTDHGPAFPFAKASLFDSGIAVALIIRVPGNQATGDIKNSLVSHIDVLPTLCEPQDLQGVSFARHLREKGWDEPVNDVIFAEMNFHISYEPARCVRTERYKYIEYLDQEYSGQNLSNIDDSITKTRFMSNSLADRKKPHRLLFDLFYDPNEKNNLIGEKAYEAIEGELGKRLLSWRRETGDPFLTGLQWQNHWIVNKRESVLPGSEKKDDFVEGHAPS